MGFCLRDWQTRCGKRELCKAYNLQAGARTLRFASVHSVLYSFFSFHAQENLKTLMFQVQLHGREVFCGRKEEEHNDKDLGKGSLPILQMHRALCVKFGTVPPLQNEAQSKRRLRRRVIIGSHHAPLFHPMLHSLTITRAGLCFCSKIFPLYFNMH